MLIWHDTSGQRNAVFSGIVDNMEGVEFSP
jgi:hypothetical protein